MVEGNNSLAASSIQAKPRKDGLKDDPGMAYLKLPYSMSYEEERELVEESRRRLKLFLEKDCDEQGWHSRLKLHGVTITSKSNPEESAFSSTKGVTEMPEGMKLDDIRCQLEYDHRDSYSQNRLFHRVDPMNYQTTIVTKVKHKELLYDDQHEEVSILWGAYYVNPFLADRDFCFVQHTLLTPCPVNGDPLFMFPILSVSSYRQSSLTCKHHSVECEAKLKARAIFFVLFLTTKTASV